MLKKIEKNPFGLRKKWKKFDFRFLNGTKFRTNIFSLGGGSGWVGLKSPCGFLLKKRLKLLHLQTKFVSFDTCNLYC